ncbi:MAG: putative MFS-type transporter YhjX [Pseudomonadota bacterium]|jgi:MFS family permease
MNQKVFYTTTPQSAPLLLPMWQVLLCGAAILILSMGVRHGFGLWLQPITQARGWGREDFAFALAIQNLAWGGFGIFIGMLADRFGAARLMVMGSVVYALGLLGMAWAASPLMFILSTGVMMGLAQACTTFAIVFGVIGRNVPVEKRSWAMGVAAAAGSFGQFMMVPVEGLLIAHLGWDQALVVLAAALLLILPAAWFMREPAMGAGVAVRREQTIAQALSEAFAYPPFLLLMAGYFVCGFQVVFIGVHMPSYLKDHGLSPQVASYALALIGLFNIVGTYVAGSLGQRYPKTQILAFIYFMRAVAIALFLYFPLSDFSVYVFSMGIGLLWLSTVPPTSATVAQIFGVAHLSMLGGFIFLSHQVGSFLGVWLGGYMYDRFGNYDLVWYLAIALGVFSAAVNLLVREAPIVRKVAHA